MNLFDLFAKITLDDSDFNRKLGAAGGAVAKFGDTLGKGLKAAATVTAVGVTATAGAVAALGKAAVEGYAEYEQLAGGAAKIFDEMSQTLILEDAQNAYKDLGMSASQYLAVINDVGAAFASTMGDEAGYEAAKTGLQAISDYASGTGKNIDELSSKFTLITRSTTSYQSIADQFSGILPATSAAFLEQAQAAGILSNSYEELTEVPINEYQAAVSQMLQRGVTDLGLYGNTAAEAATTVSGSASMMKAAWTNLVTGMADENANVDELLDKFLESVEVFGGNLRPKIGTVLESIGEALEENGPEMVAQGVVMLAKLALGIVQGIPKVVGKIPEIIRAIVDEFKELGPELKEIGGDILEGIWNGIGDKVEWLKSKVSGVVDKIKSWFTGKEGFDEHSPSKWSEKVFENVMVGGGIGLEKGANPLLSEVRSVTERVKAGMAMETASIDFAASGTGTATAGMMNGLSSVLRSGSGGQFTFNLMLPNGSLLASYILEPLAEYAQANGTPILNPN